MTVETFNRVSAELDALSDEAVSHLYAATPWQTYSGNTKRRDEDGFTISAIGDSENVDYAGYQAIQARCWIEFDNDPFISTTIGDTAGRIAGLGFGVFANDYELQAFIDDEWEDPRNDLTTNFKKYIIRLLAQGELFLSFTLHASGFVEIDFIAPSTIKGFKDSSGVLTHPNKPTMPLVYCVEPNANESYLVPSINLAYYPELLNSVDKKELQRKKFKGKTTAKKYKKLGGFKTFIVSFDRGNITKRAIGQVKTVLEWLENYQDLKRYEIDHKKSSGSYLWAIEMEDRTTLRTWLSMTDKEKASTGLMARKTPGGTLLLPPGMKLNCHNPKLSSISDTDTDILRLISTGLNVPEDVMTGSSTGQTYSGAKLSRGPMNDRVSDIIAEVDTFLKFRFFRGMFFLSAVVSNRVKSHYKERKAVAFKKKKPVFKTVKVPNHKIININYPVSASADLEGASRALLGVKHADVTNSLGIPRSVSANKLGFQSYYAARLAKATEEDIYPDLPEVALLESMAAQKGESQSSASEKIDTKKPSQQNAQNQKKPQQKTTSTEL